ncbi:MAG: hypothetical protein AYK19_12285 [Theionarchaea archaeon DG-70-1]|nr:MAG: hypothetical protein AYK19_12285 [Theionarchaea archaeon DG-70-1]
MYAIITKKLISTFMLNYSMTAKKKREREPKIVEGPFSFKLGGDTHKVKIGVTVPPLAVLYMDKAIEAGFFANRSDFITQAMLFFIERKKEEINFDQMLSMDVTEFYKFVFREKE